MKKKICKVLKAIVVAQMLVACGSSKVYGLMTKPHMLETQPPAGPAEYQQGWKDGCESGLASNNTNLHMAIGSQRFKLNRELQNYQLYNVGWQYAYNHCGYSMKALSQYSL